MNGGLIGGIGRLIDRIRAHAASVIASPASSTRNVMVMLIILTAVLSVVESVVAKQLTGLGFYKTLGLGIVCVLAEFVGLHHAIVAWHRAKPGQMAAYSCMWVIAFGFAILSTFDAASENQAARTNIQKAAYNRSADSRSDLEAARKRVDVETASLKTARDRAWAPYPSVDGKTVETADAAKALVAGFEANTRFYVDLTKKCSDTAGPNTRKFCADLAAARAAAVDLAGRAQWLAEVKAVETQLAEARSALVVAMSLAATAPTVAQDELNFVSFVSTATGARPESVRFMQSAQVAITTMLLMSLAGVVLGLGEISGQPRTRWGRGRLRQALHGASVAPGTTHTIEREVVSDRKTGDAIASALGDIDDLRSKLKVAA